MSNNIRYYEPERKTSIYMNKSCEPKNINLDDINKSAYKKHQGSILSLLIKNNTRKDSLKTSDTSNSKKHLDYDYKEIKRFDEFKGSMSDISEFDLENDKNDNKSEFNSSEEDVSEFEEIKIKSKIIPNKRKYDSDFEIELEKEYNEIIKRLKINQ